MTSCIWRIWVWGNHFGCDPLICSQCQHNKSLSTDADTPRRLVSEKYTRGEPAFSKTVFLKGFIQEPTENNGLRNGCDNVPRVLLVCSMPNQALWEVEQFWRSYQ